MATITVAEHAGACYGVQRALDMVEAALGGSSPAPVRTLGPLIHNPKVVGDLERRGVGVVDAVPDDAAGTLVLRTHGVVPQVVERARECGLALIDATCPYVKKVHAAAERLEREGWQVLVVGESGHPEVEAILGHAPGAHAVSSVEGLEGIELRARVGVVVQTTQSKALLDGIVSALTARVADVRVINTICAATSERQLSAARLAQASDVMVVIGGRNSANTTRLAEICSARCASTHHVELPRELEAQWFEGARHIGVTAGASTPSGQIEQVVETIEGLVGPASS